MGIREDAGKILLFVYKKYINEEYYLNTESIIKGTKLPAKRINSAITYLKDIGAIQITLFFGKTDGVYNFEIDGLTPRGIDIVENKKKFKSIFGIREG